ncbi:MAG TPA: ABC transporter permease, partial [Candidatus Dormibacteraeota bacterium]
MAQAAPISQPEVELTYEVPEQVTLLNDAWRRLKRNRIALVGAVIIGILLIVALISIIWTPYPVWLQAVGPTYQTPSLKHPLGLDQAGRDILSRIMGGALITVEVGIGSAIILSLIGIPLGLIAGFYRGKVDTIISFFINIWYGIPDLLVALILVFVLSDALHLIPRGVLVIIIAFALTRWMDVARLVRGQTLSLREREFVEAARMGGARDFAMLTRH